MSVYPYTKNSPNVRTFHTNDHPSIADPIGTIRTHSHDVAGSTLAFVSRHARTHAREEADSFRSLKGQARVDERDDDDERD